MNPPVSIGDRMVTFTAVGTCYCVGIIAGTPIWQDSVATRGFMIVPPHVPQESWLWPYREKDEFWEPTIARWRDSLTPAETCDLYAMLEAAIANPPPRKDPDHGNRT